MSSIPKSDYSQTKDVIVEKKWKKKWTGKKKEKKKMILAKTWIIFHNNRLMTLVSKKNENPQELLFHFLSKPFKPWPRYKPHKVHTDWKMIAMIFIKNNPATKGCDYQYDSKKIKEKNQNAFGRKDGTNLSTE